MNLLSIFKHFPENKEKEKTFRRFLCKNTMSDKLNYIKMPLPHLHAFRKKMSKAGMGKMYDRRTIDYINLIDYITQ